MKTREIIDRKAGRRRYTDEGYLIVPARIARTGIQEYRAFELGLNDGDPMRIVRIYRAPDEVFSPEAMASFDGKPITNNHPEEFVDASNWKALSVGFARKVARDGDYLTAELIVTDKAAIDLIAGGKVELSNGYTADYDWAPGTTPSGEAYDAQQKNIRGNHVAIVDAARCGPACRVSDSPTEGAIPMADRKVTIDGIPFDLPEAAAAAVDKLASERKAAQDASIAAADALAKAQTEHAAALKAKDAEIEALKKDVITPDQRDALVEAWAKLTADAARMVPNYDHKGKTCDAIRREVIAALAKDEKRKPMIDAALAGRDLASVDAESVKMVFSILAAAPATEAAPQQSRDAIADALKDQATGDNNGAATDPRAAMIDAMQNAWKTPFTQEQ